MWRGRRWGGAYQWTDVVIHHVGYRDPALRRRKLERDLRLLLMELSEQPDDAFTLFNLGCVYQEMERLEEALPLFRRSLERSDPTDSIVRKLYALIAQCHNHLGKPREALAACREGRVHYADDVEILFQEATAQRHLGETEAAIRAWEQVLQTPPGPHFASMNTGIRGHLTRHNLATAYFDLGRLDPAEAHWNAALAEQPDYVPSLLGKAELALKRRCWQDLEEVLQPLAKQAQTAADVAVWRARMHLNQKELMRARDILESAIAAHPRALWPRVILTHVLLQKGMDWPAAEQALRDVLALDPEHKEAQRNLEVLLRQQGRIA
jgi:tetratricopeptide (TPR) repeat protein